MRAYWGIRSKIPRIFNLGCRRTWVVNFPGRELLVCTDWLSGWVAQSRSARTGEGKTLLSCREKQPVSSRHSLRRLQSLCSEYYVYQLSIDFKIMLMIPSVPTVEIENMMRSRSNKFWMHHRIYIWTRRCLIGMPKAMNFRLCGGEIIQFRILAPLLLLELLDVYRYIDCQLKSCGGRRDQ